MGIIDKEKYIAFIRDEETKIFIKHNLSKLESVLKSYEIKKTDFMDPYRQRVFSSVLNSFSDEVSYRLFGGLKLAERKLFLIFPYYEQDIQDPLKLVRFESDFSFDNITHKDCLGALMSLGLTREKLGDIYIGNGYVDVVTLDNIADYIAINLTKIRHSGVKGKILPIEQIKEVKPEFIYRDIIASSLRVDVVISAALNVSRQVSSAVCENGKVKVDFEPIFSKSKELDLGSLVSVRGYGRFKIAGINGKTSKDKYRLKVGFYD